MFAKRRPASPQELSRLFESFDTLSPPAGLAEAEISEIATVDDLGSLHTVIGVPNAPSGVERYYTVAQLEKRWAAGGGSEHDRESYPRALAHAAGPGFAPELLFEPTPSTSSRWWMIDGIHRAAALYTVRTAAKTTALGLLVFVLPRPLR